MTQYSLVRDNAEIGNYQSFDGSPPTLAASKGAWLPIITVDSFATTNPVTHTRVTTRVVEADRVLVTLQAVAHPTERLTALVKTEANRRILARYPTHVQANMTARAVKLSDIRHSRPLTSDETDEKAAIEAAWDWVLAVRTASNDIELEIKAGAVPDIATHTGWPA